MVGKVSHGLNDALEVERVVLHLTQSSFNSGVKVSGRRSDGVGVIRDIAVGSEIAEATISVGLRRHELMVLLLLLSMLNKGIVRRMSIMRYMRVGSLRMMRMMRGMGSLRVHTP